LLFNEALQDVYDAYYVGGSSGSLHCVVFWVCDDVSDKSAASFYRLTEFD